MLAPWLVAALRLELLATLATTSLLEAATNFALAQDPGGREGVGDTDLAGGPVDLPPLGCFDGDEVDDHGVSV